MERPSRYCLWNLCRLFGGYNEKIFGTVCIWGMLQRCHKKTFIKWPLKKFNFIQLPACMSDFKKWHVLILQFWLISELYPFWFYTAYQKSIPSPIGASNHSSSFKIWPLLNIFQSRVQSAYNFVATSQSTLQFIIFSRSGNKSPKMPPKRTASKPVGKLKYFNFI